MKGIVMSKSGGVIGISDHGGWAVLVTAARNGTLLDRRRVELVDDDLPAIPHHHEAQMLSSDEGVALVERVRASVERYAAIALDAVTKDVGDVFGIALRERQPLPPTIAERINDPVARNVADWVMYRDVLASAAAARALPVYWFEPKNVCSEAGRALGLDSFDAHFLDLRRSLGSPWNQDHKLALAAAIVAANALAK